MTFGFRSYAWSCGRYIELQLNGAQVQNCLTDKEEEEAKNEDKEDDASK